MFEKFRRNITFLRQLWESIEVMAIFEEKREETVATGMKLFQLSIKKLMKVKSQKEIDDIEAKNSPNGFEYCSEILKNIEMIKLITLDYLYDAANIIYKVNNNIIKYMF